MLANALHALDALIHNTAVKAAFNNIGYLEYRNHCEAKQLPYLSKGEYESIRKSFNQ